MESVQMDIGAKKAYSNMKKETDSLRKRANEYLEKNSITITDFAKEIDYSRTAVSQFLSGKYNPDSVALEMKITRFLEENQTIQEEKIKKALEFYVTKDVQNIFAVCKSAQETQGLGVIVGKSGFGKTETLKRYSKLDRVCYVECNEMMSARDFVKAIEKSIRLPFGYGSICERVGNIIDFFNINKGYLLIIDEADKLMNKYTQTKIEMLRDILDKSDAAIVIAGEPRLETMIKTYIPRFANRVDFFITLGGLKRDEVIEYLQPFNITEEAREELIIRATNPTTGCFRLLDRTLKNIMRLAGINQTIDIKTIEKASNMMML